MRISRSVLVVIASLVAVSGGMQAAAMAGSAEGDGTVYSGSFICPDLAHTELFRAKGLEHVHTMAFAEAMLAAEQVGAKDCVPGKVARAKELLETARRATAEYHYDGVVIEPFFTRAENAAEELMEERRMAAASGFICYSKN